MRHARTQFSLSFALAVIVFVGALSTGTASASSGKITLAEASADWTSGHIAGWVEWTGCEHWVNYEGGFLGETNSPSPYCGWVPYATVGPGSKADECASGGRRLPSLGADVTLAWSGGEQTRYYPKYTETIEFDVSEVPLNGEAEQLVCLSLIEIAPEYVICIQIFPSPCPPYWMARFRHDLDSAQMIVSAPTEPPSEGEEESEPEGAESEAGEEDAKPPEETGESAPSKPEDISTGEKGIEGGETVAPLPLPPAGPHSSTQPKRYCPRRKRRVRPAGHTACRHRWHKHASKN